MEVGTPALPPSPSRTGDSPCLLLDGSSGLCPWSVPRTAARQGVSRAQRLLSGDCKDSDGSSRVAARDVSWWQLRTRVFHVSLCICLATCRTRAAFTWCAEEGGQPLWGNEAGSVLHFKVVLPSCQVGIPRQPALQLSLKIKLLLFCRPKDKFLSRGWRQESDFSLSNNSIGFPCPPRQRRAREPRMPFLLWLMGSSDLNCNVMQFINSF